MTTYRFTGSGQVPIISGTVENLGNGLFKSDRPLPKRLFEEVSTEPESQPTEDSPKRKGSSKKTPTGGND